MPKIITRDDAVSQRHKFRSTFLSNFSWESKIAFFFNFPISHASYKKLCDCYWLQLRITCKSGWIVQAEKDTASANKEAKVRLLHREGQSQVLPCRLCYPLLPLVTLFYPLLPCVTLCYPLSPCVPLCYPVFPSVTLCYPLLPYVTLCYPLLACVTLCYPLLPCVPCVALCYPLLPCVTLCHPVLPCVILCYPLLPCVTLCYPVLPFVTQCSLCYPLLPSVVLENNKEPRTYGCLAALTKIACFYVSKEVKENAKSDQRSNPVGQKQKPQKPIKMYA